MSPSLSDPLSAQVRHILFAEWDPRGINSDPHFYGEYDSFIAPLLELMQSEPMLSREIIEERLARFESETMSIDPQLRTVRKARRRTAAALLDLFNSW